MLDLPATGDDGRYSWQRVTPADVDYIPPGRALLHVLTDRARWQAAVELARRRADHDQTRTTRGRDGKAA